MGGNLHRLLSTGASLQALGGRHGRGAEDGHSRGPQHPRRLGQGAARGDQVVGQHDRPPGQPGAQPEPAAEVAPAGPGRPVRPGRVRRRVAPAPVAPRPGAGPAAAGRPTGSSPRWHRSRVAGRPGPPTAPGPGPPADHAGQPRASSRACDAERQPIGQHPGQTQRLVFLVGVDHPAQDRVVGRGRDGPGERGGAGIRRRGVRGAPLEQLAAVRTHSPPGRPAARAGRAQQQVSRRPPASARPSPARSSPAKSVEEVAVRSASARSVDRDLSRGRRWS